MGHFEVVILGTGTAGQTAAHHLAGEGLNVAIVESSSTPGGTCALFGCQAKKWLYEVTETVARCNHLRGLGITAPPQVNWQEIIAAKNRFTSKVPENTVKSLAGSKITYFNAQGSLIDTNRVQVGTDTIQADFIILATGATPRPLSLKGHEHICTSNDFLDFPQLPPRIAFIGGGFISFEFAHFAARLGSSKGQIHIILRSSNALRSFDSEMVDLLTIASEQEGIQIHTEAQVESVTQNKSGYRILLTSGESIEVDRVVHGAGRVANISQLNLANAGIEASPQGIPVNSHMRSSVPNIYAIGDCVNSPQLARVADQEAHIAARNIIASREGSTKKSQMDYGSTPIVLFTYPQLAMVGKTEDQLKQEQTRYWKSYSSNLAWPTYRRIGMRNAAFKILVDNSGKFLGAHILSDNATGLINTIKQAMIDDISVSHLHECNILAPYPSRESDLIYMLAPLLDD
ncbi:dihydrolipoyl dehydrogenase family protein [Desulfosediminicola ganghwensis]|uniref:dihydrolipoyl dehydrogenase family protein n=1 Tax=Desulfosediminicola ganghwensis TaxID=2569540 RepID=UPI0010AD1197|nr:NAD(P)/FAD-dependent oxidoreductase [Desulfosediminicola ganghwensis]